MNVSFEDKETQYIAGISFANFKQFNENNFKPDTILCLEEINEFNRMRYEKRKRDFLMGRYCAKFALKEIVHDISIPDICIHNGFFKQPIIEYSININCDVSISHCECYGISIAFPNELMVGIDVEMIRERSMNTIKSQLTQTEKKQIDLFQNTQLYTVMWTIKEALSKALKIGFTVPLNIYEIDKIRYDGLLYNCTFVNFPQFQAVAYIIKCYVVTIVYPANLKLTGRESLINFLSDLHM